MITPLSFRRAPFIDINILLFLIWFSVFIISFIFTLHLRFSPLIFSFMPLFSAAITIFFSLLLLRHFHYWFSAIDIFFDTPMSHFRHYYLFSLRFFSFSLFSCHISTLFRFIADAVFHIFFAYADISLFFIRHCFTPFSRRHYLICFELLFAIRFSLSLPFFTPLFIFAIIGLLIFSPLFQPLFSLYHTFIDAINTFMPPLRLVDFRFSFSFFHTPFHAITPPLRHWLFSPYYCCFLSLFSLLRFLLHFSSFSFHAADVFAIITSIVVRRHAIVADYYYALITITIRHVIFRLFYFRCAFAIDAFVSRHFAILFSFSLPYYAMPPIRRAAYAIVFTPFHFITPRHFATPRHYAFAIDIAIIFRYYFITFRCFRFSAFHIFIDFHCRFCLFRCYCRQFSLFCHTSAIFSTLRHCFWYWYAISAFFAIFSRHLIFSLFSRHYAMPPPLLFIFAFHCWCLTPFSFSLRRFFIYLNIAADAITFFIIICWAAFVAPCLRAFSLFFFFFSYYY